MEKHGWDKFRENGLKELTNIKESRVLADKEAQISFLEKYLEIYREQKEHEIKATAFYSDRVGKDEAQKKAADIIKRLRQSIKRYYESEEGKRSLYEIYFIADQRDYHLGIRFKTNNRQQIDDEETILYNEHPYFITVQKPFIIRSLSLLFSFLSPFLIFSCALLIILEKSHNSWIILFIGYSGLIIGVSFIYLGVVLNRLLSRQLANVLAKFFFKMSNQHVALVSYSGKCTVKGCLGDVTLSSDFQKGIGYIAECSKYPDGHRFNIDPITLKGERIKA